MTLTSPGGPSTTLPAGFTVTAATHVTGVDSTIADGTYFVGAIIPITVTFSAPVTVTGTPALALNSGRLGYLLLRYR